MRHLALLVPALLLTSCGLYFDNDPCRDDFGGEAAPDIDAVGQRNPDTGLCEYYGGGPYPCDGSCGPCPAGAEADLAQLSWGYCESECTGLEEGSCLEAPGCRGIYVDPCAGTDCLAEPVYAECWSTDLSGPIQGGECAGLDAYECSRHDDCVAIHRDSCTPIAGEGDAPEPATCTIADFLRCGNEDPDTDPDPGLCYAPVDCTSEPPACPADTMPGIAEGCWTGYCIPVADCEAEPACSSIDVEASCVARTDCTPLYRGEDCSCDDSGCTCTSWTFTSCE